MKNNTTKATNIPENGNQQIIEDRRGFLKRAFAGLVIIAAASQITKSEPETTDEDFKTYVTVRVNRMKHQYDSLPGHEKAGYIQNIEKTYQGLPDNNSFTDEFFSQVKSYLTGGAK